MITLGYTRVSTIQQAEHGISIAAQKKRIRQYADLHELELLDVVSDEGASSKTLDRAGLQQVLRMLDDGGAQALLVTHLDRLTRRLVDLSHLLEHYFCEGKFQLLAVYDNIDTRSASGRLALNILGSVTQWEREAIGERTRQAMRWKKQRQEYTGGKVPYGWDVADDGKMLIPNNDEQAGIALAREMREGDRPASLRKIAAKLAQEGHLARSGNPLGPSAIKAILVQEE